MYTKFNAVKSVLLVMALCLFIMGCTDEGILGLQEETEVFEESLSSESSESLSAKGAKRNFNASLKGGNEVPPVASKAVGEAIVKIIIDDEDVEQSEVHFKVNVANIMDVTQAHFHMAPSGNNGSAVAFIFPFTNDLSGRINGTLVEGSVTSGDFLILNYTMEEFIMAIRNGEIYVNVHTDVNKSGEIRGQLR